MANKPQPNFEFCKNYGENYKRLRTDKGLTQKELAKALNIVHSTISDIEKSKNPPTIEQLQAYHKYFNVSYEYLLGETKAQSLDIQMICEYTGLSENAVEKLHEFYTVEYGHRYFERVVGLLTIEAEPDNGWISVEDRLPELGQRVMAFCRAGIMTFLRYDGEVWFEMSSKNEYLLSFVTHWQPLPEPPKEEK